jgi:hypothetical protein
MMCLRIRAVVGLFKSGLDKHCKQSRSSETDCPALRWATSANFTKLQLENLLQEFRTGSAASTTNQECSDDEEGSNMTRSLFKSAAALAIVAGFAASSIGWAGPLGPSDRLEAGRAGANLDRAKGDSTYSKGSKAFEIKDFSFSVENPTTIGSATGGAGAGKSKFNEFSISKIPASTSKNGVKCRGSAC